MATSPEYGKAIIFLQRANAQNNTQPRVWNEKPAMDGTQPIKMSLGALVPEQYGPVTSDASNPPYCPSFHTTTRLTTTFNNLKIFNPDYDVVDLIVGAKYNATAGDAGRITAGLKILVEEDDNASAKSIFNTTTSIDTMAINLVSPRDNASPAAGYYATAGLWSNSLANENAAGFSGSSATLAAAPDMVFGQIPATCGSLKGQAATLNWQPWNGTGLAVPANGVPQWIAIRYHKYDPAFPGQCKISVVASWDATVRTLTFTAFGSQVGSGIPINCIQNQNYNMIGRMVLAYDIASEATAWDAAIAAQAARWVNLVEDKSITQYLDNLRGPYQRNTGAVVDQTTGTYYDVQGQIVSGREIEIHLPTGSTALDYNVIGGWPSDSGSQAGVWFIGPDGSQTKAFIKNWGYGAAIRNYLGNTTAGFTTQQHGNIRLVVPNIPDLRGYYILVTNSTGGYEMIIPISAVSYVGDAASAYTGGGTGDGDTYYVQN